MSCVNWCDVWNWPSWCTVLTDVICFCSWVSCVWIGIGHPKQVCLDAKWLMFKRDDQHVLDHAWRSMMAANRISKNSRVKCITEDGTIIRSNSVIARRARSESPTRVLQGKKVRLTDTLWVLLNQSDTHARIFAGLIGHKVTCSKCCLVKRTTHIANTSMTCPTSPPMFYIKQMSILRLLAREQQPVVVEPRCLVSWFL